jgi:hypothetical protein
MKDKMVPGKCNKACGQPGTIMQGTNWLCDKHYRFQQMRISARRNGKTVPSWGKLERILPKDMICVVCKCTMNWRSKNGRKTVITLQHDESGEHRLICLSCNDKHGSGPKDLIYSIPDDHKHCPKCRQIKHKSQFGESKRSTSGCTPNCRECINNYDRNKYKNTLK